jgi:periplasmic divalent cation tolerance protein
MHDDTPLRDAITARRDALVALILRAHPYDLPVITWEAVETTAEAAGWCDAETAPQSD